MSDKVGDAAGFDSSRTRRLNEERKAAGLSTDDKVEMTSFLSGLGTGLRDGTTLVGNAATFGQVPGLKAEADRLVQENGGLYSVADASAKAGVAILATVATGAVAKGVLQVARAGVAALPIGSCTITTGATVVATAAVPALAVAQADAIGTAGAKLVDSIANGSLSDVIRDGTGLLTSALGFKGAVASTGKIAQMVAGGPRSWAAWWRSIQACFAAGTPLRTPEGSKNIEEFKAGDLLLSRDEFDPAGPVEAKAVEEVFVRLGRVFHLHVGGRVIRTTPEHPFYVLDRGWVPAGELSIGESLLGADGEILPVEDLLDTGEYERVYNIAVEDWHTYFVGAKAWGFSVWAHNYDPPVAATPPTKGNKTSGVLHVEGEAPLPLMSGVAGPSQAVRGQGLPGFNGNQLTHVEGHAAAHMRTNKIQNAVLDISKVPCTKGSGGGCEGLLPKMLPEGATLRVRGPNGYDTTFTGLPD